MGGGVKFGVQEWTFGGHLTSNVWIVIVDSGHRDLYSRRVPRKGRGAIVTGRPSSPVARVLRQTTSSSTAAAVDDCEQDEHSSTILVTDDGDDDGVEGWVDNEHVETEVGERVKTLAVDQLVVGQQDEHVNRQQAEHGHDGEHDQRPDHTTSQRQRQHRVTLTW